LLRIGLTGWEIFSKVDAVKSNLNQAEDISPRVFRLLKGPSISESNQRGKRNKNHMNPLIQLKKATPLFVIALVLACFVLSPQAFGQAPTFSPANWSGCQHSIGVKISTPISGAFIGVAGGGEAGHYIANNDIVDVANLGASTLMAQACKRMPDGTIQPVSVWGYSTYTYCSWCCPYIRLLRPNGGEVFTIGQNYNIHWSRQNPGGNTVDIFYSTDNGATWIRIVIQAPDTTGFYLWNVTGPVTTTAKLRIRYHQTPSVNDMSDAVFRIVR
jgi:hypothetical protein